MSIFPTEFNHECDVKKENIILSTVRFSTGHWTVGNLNIDFCPFCGHKLPESPISNPKSWKIRERRKSVT